MRLLRSSNFEQIEDKFSPFAKRTLTTLITFLQVSCSGDSCFLSLRVLWKDEILPAVKIAHLQLPTDQETRWMTVIPIIEELKVKAKKLGLWNLFLSKAHYPQYGVPLSNLEVRLEIMSYADVLNTFCQYAVMAEVLGRAGPIGPQAVNCSAPDTGNMGGVP